MGPLEDTPSNPSLSSTLPHPSIHPASSFSSSLLRSVRPSPSWLPHFPHHLNSPGHRFWMAWRGHAKRRRFLKGL
eukprot:7880676-Pyramimonas_sp.AAC.1